MKKLTARQIARARRLRGTLTDAERLLWQHLRQRQLAGFKFRRQHPAGRYVMDFACLEKKLAIEVDGGQHAEMRQKDHRRELVLKQEGFQVLRFWNNEVLNNIDGVIECIWTVLVKKD